MATNKTATLTFRIEPALKEALRTVAELQHRSIANMVEVLIRDYCEHQGIKIAQPNNHFINQEKIQTVTESE